MRQREKERRLIFTSRSNNLVCNGMAISSSISVIVTLSLTLLFFFFINSTENDNSRRRSLIETADHGGDRHRSLTQSLPALTLLAAVHFYLLIKTAQDHFSPVTTTLSSLLNLSPSMAAVTLLALGNGAPDLFASLAALRSGHHRTGLAAILSAGAFVSSFVVGSVAVLAAPFPLNPATFIRDVSFYLVAVMSLFYVYLSAEIYLWQAAGFVAFYIFFVGFVFWMDLGMVSEERERSVNGEMRSSELATTARDCEVGDRSEDLGLENRSGFGFRRVLTTISRAWELPFSILLKLTIPQTSPSEWSRFYMSANIALCPLALLYAANSFVRFDHPIPFLSSRAHFPLWLVVLFGTSSLALLHFATEREPPKTEQIPVVLLAFVMSVFWISTVAGELLGCLAAIGSILELPPAILGLTVLAWGNSVGDLVADVAVARAGHPAMAVAGCFAGPMFNMLVGLGSALVIQTGKVYPEAYRLDFHFGIVVAFIFLLLSLMGSLLVITWHRFRVPKFWGFCLVGLYLVFTAVSLLIAKFLG